VRFTTAYVWFDAKGRLDHARYEKQRIVRMSAVEWPALAKAFGVQPSSVADLGHVRDKIEAAASKWQLSADQQSEIAADFASIPMLKAEKEGQL